MAKGQYDRAAAAAKRVATEVAKAEAAMRVDLSAVIVGEFFIYEKCLWVRITDMNLLGTAVKQYNQLSDENGLFCCLTGGTMDPKWVRALADDAKITRLVTKL